MKKRIVTCLAILLILCVVGDAIALFSLSETVAQLRKLVEFHRIQALRTSLVSDGVRLRADLIARLADRPVPAKMVHDHIERFNASLTACGSCHHEPDVQPFLDQQRQTFDRYRGAIQALDIAAPDRKPEFERTALSVVDELNSRSLVLSDRALRHLTLRSDDMTADVSRAWRVLCLTMISALICGGIVAFHLKNRITRPVESLLDGIARARSGEPGGTRLSPDADEEFRELADAFDQAYGELKQAQKNMVQAEKMAAIGTLAAGVAHEVGNPLSSISAVAQVMQRKCQDETQKEQLDLILAETRRISKIIRDLLTFSRRSDQRIRDAVDISAVIQRVLTLVGYDRRTRDVEITSDVADDVGPVWGDPDRILLVFLNVVINAVDAIGENGGKGTLKICVQAVDGRAVVSFVDDGPGMAEQQLASAFEPFVTGKEPGKGTGLGLWICHQVVQQHEGEIRIVSETGRGVTVTVVLPLADGDVAQTDAIERDDGSPVALAD
jgi:signal transduction histidine kinase